ncbi:MAG: Precorrin-3B methylase [Cyanobacteria bacterium J06621_8]
MVAKKKKNKELKGKELVKEVCRRIRIARSYWDAHNNAACRGERDKAIALYNTLTPEQKEQIPQQLRIWLRYRSEKYFGKDKPNGMATGKFIKKNKRKKTF